MQFVLRSKLASHLQRLRSSSEFLKRRFGRWLPVREWNDEPSEVPAIIQSNLNNAWTFADLVSTATLRPARHHATWRVRASQVLNGPSPASSRKRDTRREQPVLTPGNGVVYVGVELGRMIAERKILLGPGHWCFSV